MADPPVAPPQTLDINSIIAGLTAGGGASSGNFVGFPAGVGSLQSSLAEVPPGQQAPRYGEGSQWLPVLTNSTPADIAKLQDQLTAAGLLDVDYRRGVWDGPSMKAFEDVLGLANASGTEWPDALKNYTDGTPMMWDPKTNSYIKGTAGSARTRAPLTTRYTNPDDLASAAQEVAVSKLGRTFTPAELQKFVNSYHGVEGSSQSSAYAASGAGGGGYTEAPSVGTAAETFAKQTDPNAYNAEQFLPLVQKMNDLLSGPGLNTTKPMSA